jgi:hypothetical protein
MIDYRIMREWSDQDAEYFYEFQIWTRKEHNHSCYSCYDDWSWRRNKCHNNGDRWETKSRGNLAWAKRLAKHHKLVIGDTKGK